LTELSLQLNDTIEGIKVVDAAIVVVKDMMKHGLPFA
jgi:hypothetical protein